MAEALQRCVNCPIGTTEGLEEYNIPAGTYLGRTDPPNCRTGPLGRTLVGRKRGLSPSPPPDRPSRRLAKIRSFLDTMPEDSLVLTCCTAVAACSTFILLGNPGVVETDEVRTRSI